MYSLDGLQDRLKEHAQSLDSLLRLIPAKYYITDKDDADELNSKYQHNKRKQAPKQAIKEATKKAKRAKLDPDNVKSIPELQLEKAKKKQLEAEAETEPEADSGIEEDQEDVEMEGNDDDEGTGVDEELDTEDTAKEDAMPVEGRAPTNLATKPMESANITDLHLRLQHRIAELRAKRHASSGDAASKAPSRDAILEMRLKHKEKRKQMKEKRKQKEKHARVQSEEIVKGAAGAAQQHKANGVTGPSPASIKEDGEVRFSKVEMGEAVQKKKGPTDAKGQLKKAEAKMEKMEKLKAENKEKAETLAEKETWKKALAMASGEKVRDDVKLLKKTVKREEKIKKRSEKAWTERKDTVQKQQAHKQKKRQDNIQARIEQKKDKGGKGKKPKARPGFEGGKPKKSKK